MKIIGYHFKFSTSLYFLIVLFALAGHTGAQTVTSISVEPADPHIDVGDFIQFRAVGTLSDGSARVLSPVPTLIAASEWSHTCAVLTNGTVKCWGYNSNGELGAGTPPLEAPWYADTPINVKYISNAITVATGQQHSCAILSDGTVECWGANVYGQLGHGDTATPYYTPVPVSGVTNAIAVAGGKLHTCALLSDGTVQCWGYNYAGQLGVDRTGPETCSYSACSTTPVHVAGVTNALGIAAGDEHSCALLADGTVRCWGWNYYGQSGNGDGIQYHITPVTVSGINTAVAIDADGHHTCALLAEGTLKCWGSNFYGELGNGTTNTAYTPATVSGINNAIDVDSGRDFSCAVLADASAKCWGKGEYGSLGNGANNDSWVPVPVSEINSAISITAGALHACALLSNGVLKCWGYNTYGALGDGTGIQSNVPVEVKDLMLDGTGSVLWSSSNPEAATINNGGAIGIGDGVSTITATLGELNGSTTLTVGTVLQHADIAVTKTDNPDPVAAAQNLTYTVSVTNNGPDTATGVIVTDTLPAGVTFISATPSQGVCTENCGVVTCNLGELAATSLPTVTIVVIPGSPGVIYNTAQALANENDPNPSNNAQTIPTVVIPSSSAPDISVSPASHEFGSIAAGSSSSKTFLISNEGTAGLTIGALSIVGPQASEFSIGNDTCSGQVIPVDKDCTVDVVFSPVSEGPKGASLSVTSDDPDESPLLVSLSGGDYTVHLHSRTFTPAPGISQATRDAIVDSGLPRVHVLVQTRRVPKTSELNELTTMGLRLLVFIPNLAFFASLPADAQSVDSIAAHPVIRAVMLIAPEDRIAGNIKDGIDARLQYSDGAVALEVFSFFDVPMADARTAIASFVSEILAESERIRGFLVRLSPGAIDPLSQSDLVQFISEVAPPAQDDNDQVRIVTNVSNVQIVEDTTDGAGNMTGTQPGAPYALDGAGVAIGQ